MTAAEKSLAKVGWRLALTVPLHGSFHFERFVGKRRVAAVILFETTTPRAWRALKKMLTDNAPEDTW